MRATTLLLPFFGLMVLPVACGGPEYGIGQGQPAYPERSVTAAARLDLAIQSVFVGKNPAQAESTNSALGYVLLANTGTTAIDFNQVSLSLVSSRGMLPLTPASVTELATPLPAGSTVALNDASMAAFSQHLGYPTGQVAIVDDAFNVQAYLAWGTTAPGPGAFPLTTAALQSGAITAMTDNFYLVPAASAAAATSVYLSATGATPL